jgi:hypothetical protein
MSMTHENKDDGPELTLSVMDDAERHWHEKEREWWEQADRLLQWIPPVKEFVVRCCRQAFISGYLIGIDEEQKRHASPRR